MNFLPPSALIDRWWSMSPGRNSSISIFRLLLTIAVALPGAASASTVFTDSVIIDNHLIAFPPASYGIAASISSANDYATELVVSIDGNSVLTSVTGTIALGANWYVVQDGDVVGPGMVASGNLLAGLIGGNSFGQQLQLQPGQNFMIGFWIDAGDYIAPGTTGERGDGIPGLDDRFGWVTLNYTPAGGLTVVESATSITDPIIAGTTTTIPESSSLAIAALSCGLLVRRRR